MQSETLAVKNIALKYLLFNPFKPLKTREGWQSYIHGSALCQEKDVLLSLCSLGFNFLTLEMKFSISLGRSRKNKQAVQ